MTSTVLPESVRLVGTGKFGLCVEPDPGLVWRGGVAAEHYAVFVFEVVKSS